MIYQQVLSGEDCLPNIVSRFFVHLLSGRSCQYGKRLKEGEKMIDFSCKHDVLIEDEDGTRRPMDEPYFASKLIAPDTWLIRSDGDASYLVAGNEQAVLIDSGYGAGNIREYCQSLTDKPVRYIINTHDHFDHTANNCYFEKAYMTAASKELATIPFPSFEGIDFPRDYLVEIVKDGDSIDLGGRPLEFIEIPDHAVGSIAILDSRERILFGGDEISGNFKKVNTSMSNVKKQFEKLWAKRDSFDVIWPGTGQSCSADVVKTYIELFDEILSGNEGESGFGFGGPKGKGPKPQAPAEEGVTVFPRFRARPCDMKLDPTDKALRHIGKDGIMVMFTPDVVK